MRHYCSPIRTSIAQNCIFDIGMGISLAQASAYLLAGTSLSVRQGFLFSRLLALAGIVIICGVGCSRISTPMRFQPTGNPKATSFYIQTKEEAGTPTYSCSFVEFDGRGDYIDFEQHTSAWKTVRRLAEKEKVLLVFYCHGWKNNSQSSDVVEFNSFLGRLAASNFIQKLGCRVHGIYLSWRGNLYQPYVDEKSKFFEDTVRDFGEPIVDRRFHRCSQWDLALPENLSYWGRLRAAENEVSGIPMARTIYTCASLVKALDKKNHRTELTNSSRVLVIGHSFGALVLERALSLTCLDSLTKEWSWFDTAGKELAEEKNPQDTSNNPLPLDFVLFVNSAAPAIYAKEMRDFLAAHRSALQANHSRTTNAPVIISLTSSADTATGVLHPIANILAPLYPSLHRYYTNLLLNGKPAHQSTFYSRTPGHHPLLVDHWIVTNAHTTVTAMTREEVFNSNLDYNAANPLEFQTISRDSEDKAGKDSSTARQAIVPWVIKDAEVDRKHRNSPPIPSAYWVIRCDSGLIRDHNDVWSNTAMELYAGLYRMVEAARGSHN